MAAPCPGSPPTARTPTTASSPAPQNDIVYSVSTNGGRAFSGTTIDPRRLPVGERTANGLPPLNVVSATGLPLTPECRRGIDSGVLVAREMFTSITRDGVRFADGSEVRADAILWVTGFRAALDHLAPLHLRERGGGIRMDGTTVVKDTQVQLVEYGPSASTLGATRAGRTAALRAIMLLGERSTARRAG